MLTRVAYPSIAGINGVAWDAVELPSQFMENFVWRAEVLPLISAHVDSGEPLPVDMLQRLVGTRTFNAALDTLRQIELASFDFELHANFDAGLGANVAETLAAVRRRVAVVPAAPFNRMPASFAHIFAGGYAAGYYSYKWAEVLAADAFEAFEEAGVFDAPRRRGFAIPFWRAAAAWTPWTRSFGFAAASRTCGRCSNKPESRRESVPALALPVQLLCALLAASRRRRRQPTGRTSATNWCSAFTPSRTIKGSGLATLHSGSQRRDARRKRRIHPGALERRHHRVGKIGLPDHEGTGHCAGQAAGGRTGSQSRDHAGAGRGGRAQRGGAAYAGTRASPG